MAFSYPREAADVWVPDGTALPAALDRTTHLGVGAHQDDLELMALVPIAGCLGDPGRWFTGVTCTDGAGSARGGPFAALTDDEMVRVRRAEQRQAAELGGYSAVVQLGHPSASIRGEGHAALVDELVELLDSARPTDVYTHNLADKHATHVATAAAVLEAVRALPAARRPARLLGVEGWRSLDWLDDDEKVLLDSTGLDGLAQGLTGVFASQIVGAKRYDLAEQGRRRANATLFDPRALDRAEEVTFAMDLTPLVLDDHLDPAGYVGAAIDRLKAEVTAGLRRYFP